MIGSVAAELLVLRKRTGVWTLLAIWTALAVFFAYALPYVSFLNNGSTAARSVPADILPVQLVGTLIVGFPFFGGAIALILGVLAVGSDYDWGTLKTLFIQGPGRMQVFAAKLAALGIVLVPFVLTVFAAGAASSLLIAWWDSASLSPPSAWTVLRAFAGAWLILAVWTALGVMLAVLLRGTALAVGIGILYALVVEGLISAFASQLSALESLVQFFVRANAYSLAQTLGASMEESADSGPGSFSGPYVGGGQALLVLGTYLLLFLGVSGWVLWRRDVT